MNEFPKTQYVGVRIPIELLVLIDARRKTRSRYTTRSRVIIEALQSALKPAATEPAK